MICYLILSYLLPYQPVVPALLTLGTGCKHICYRPDQSVMHPHTGLRIEDPGCWLKLDYRDMRASRREKEVLRCAETGLCEDTVILMDASIMK